MTKNKAARKRLRNCISDLWLSRRKGRTDAQIELIDAKLTEMEDEYFALDGKSADASYSEITGQLSAAVAGLKKIKADRDKFTNNLVTASKLLGSISSVLKLVN